MRVLSGIQPSGALHLGNYFGSIKPNLELSAKAKQSVFFVADLHALTTMQDKNELLKMRQEIVLDYLACGFDPETSIIFYQSQVPQHTELMWVLSTLTPMGLLERAVSYKEKVEKGISASAGLFTYPVLMAADILLYDATHVPVGKDQKQHLEIARDLAIKFNNAYGDTLTVPEPVIGQDIAVIPGIDGQKMSKSYGNTIPLFGDEKAVKQAIMGIVTDSKGMSDPKDPDTCVIYQIHKLFLDEKEKKALADEYKNGLPYGEAKKKLLAAYMDHFAAMRQKRDSLKPAAIKEVMIEGATKASKIAGKTLDSVYSAVGLQ
jgi:tryptophanyl-tRNA synthetase